MTTPTIVAGTAAQAYSGLSNSPNVALGSGFAAGDLLVIAIGQQFSASNTYNPSSFSGGSGKTWWPVYVGGEGNGTTGLVTITYARFATAADVGATITVNFNSTNTYKSIGFVAVRGCAGLPVAKAISGAAVGSTSSTQSLASAAVTTQEPNALVLETWFAQFQGAPAGFSWSTQPTGTIVAAAPTAGQNYPGVLMATETQAARGATTAQTATASVTTSGSLSTAVCTTLAFYGTAAQSQVGARGGTANTGQASITVPDFFQAGDLAILSINAASAPTTPSGWTLLGSITGLLYVYAKDLVAGDIGATITPSVTPNSIAIEAFYNWGLNNSASLTSLFIGTATVASGTTLTAPATTVPIVGAYTYQVWSPQYTTSRNVWGVNFPATNGVESGSWQDSGQTWGSNAGWAIGTDSIGTSHEYQSATGTAPTVTWTSPNTFSATTGVAQLLIPAISPPLAPTLDTPAMGTYEDLSGTPSFSWTYNPTTGDGPQSAIAFRRKPSGGPSYSWWNSGSSTWQSTSLYFGQTAQSYSFPSGSWSDGTVYNWNVSTQEGYNNQQSPYAASDFTVTGQGPPTVSITAPTGTIQTTTPTVTATVTPYASTGAVITGARLVIYTAAQVAAGGFNPGVTAGVYDTGMLAESSSPVSFAVPAGYLTNGGSYEAYVQATETGAEASAWASHSFAVSFDAPAQPTVQAVPVAANATGTIGPAALVTVTGHDNLLSATDATADGGSMTWGNSANVTVTQSSSQYLDGTQSFALTATASGGAISNSNGVPAVAGQSYIMVAAFIKPSGAAVPLNPAMLWLDNIQTEISQVGTTAGTSTAFGWTFVIVPPSVAPAGTAYVAGQLQYTAGVANDVVYADEIGIFPGDTLGYQLEVLSDAPVAYWPLEDPIGATTAGNAVRSGDGTVSGTVTFGEAGPIASDPSQTAALFDGSTGYISTAHLSAFDATTFSVECLFQWNGVVGSASGNTDWMCPIDKGGFTGTGWSVLVNSTTGEVRLYIAGTVAASFVATLDTAWHHLVATYDGAHATVYLDGVQRTQAVFSTNPTDTTHGIWIGNGQASPSFFWRGEIAHAAFYASALSAARVLAHYNAGVGTAGNIVQKWTRGGLASSGYATVYRSADDGATWTELRAGTVAMTDGAAVFTDYEAPTNATVLYEATVTAPALGITSPDSSPSSVVVPPGTFVWVHDPIQPDTHVHLNLLTTMSANVGGVSGVGFFALQHEETQTVDYALGRSDPVVQHGDQHYPTTDLAWTANKQTDYDDFMALRGRKRTLCFRFRDGSVLYATTGAALADLVLRPPDGTVDPTTQAEGVSGLPAWQPRALQTTITAVATP